MCGGAPAETIGVEPIRGRALSNYREATGHARSVRMVMPGFHSSDGDSGSDFWFPLLSGGEWIGNNSGGQFLYHAAIWGLGF